MFFRRACFWLCWMQWLAASVIDFTAHEASLYSQNGEDGVIAKIFQTIPPSSYFCVELGANDGITDSQTYLLKLQGWKSLSLDRSYEVPPYHLYKEFITAENIEVLFQEYQVPEEFDFLSIDLDYNTFHIWKAIGETYRPAVVVVAFNGTYPCDEDKVVPYRPFYIGDGTDYFGASILSFYKLGRAKGYSLVYVDQSGSNLFFIRDDLILSRGLTFKNSNDVSQLYRPAVRQFAADSLDRPFTSTEEIFRK